MAKLDGKVALITGGTTGIGAATARLFRQEGATVIVTGSNPETLEAARRELRDIEVVAADAADVAATRALVRDIHARHGHLDVLFVNAGVARMAPSSEVDERQFDALFNVNVRGAYFAIRYAAEIMSDGGAIVLTASVSGVTGGPGQTVYGATKAALRSFGRTFAGELAPRGIRVNTISPGPIETPIFGKTGVPASRMEAMVDDMLKKIPLRRIGQPEEVAAAALFLASADSSFTTGGELFVDGGMVDV